MTKCQTKVDLTEKIRQILTLLYLIKPLRRSRKFCQKCVRENSRNFHIVPILQGALIKIALFYN